MFPTIETKGYYNRENQWVVIFADETGWHWYSTHDTKVDAVETLREITAERGHDFGMVVKSPYVVCPE